MSYDYGIPSSLLQFLGACIFGDAKKYFSSQNEYRCVELEAEVRDFGLTAWFYRYLYDVLPKAEQVEYRKNYQAHQVKAILGEQELKRLYRVLAAHGLRFVPIKGADLAYRLYPDTALRVFVDWDIWFHPDDCERALAALAEDGWKVPEHYSDANEAAFKTAKHHFSPHVRGQYTVEPHFTLANFDDVDLHEMWEHTMEYPAGDGQRVLSPEIKFLLPVRLSAQQATRYYARPYTARSRAGRKNILYTDSPQAAGYRTREMNEPAHAHPSCRIAIVLSRSNSKTADGCGRDHTE